jgi:hypothetical protein
LKKGANDRKSKNQISFWMAGKRPKHDTGTSNRHLFEIALANQHV